ncbi:hypothetical protein F2P79_008406 [Pimephales promelas]|nr:hypothetical protein F2P79_008406 [Pimephales promelas]
MKGKPPEQLHSCPLPLFRSRLVPRGVNYLRELARCDQCGPVDGEPLFTWNRTGPVTSLPCGVGRRLL